MIERTINTADLHNVVLQRKKEYGELGDLIEGIVEEMVDATPKTERIVQDSPEKCREYRVDALEKFEILGSLNWIDVDETHSKCNQCGAVFEIVSANGEANYCPNCGCFMMKEKKNEH